MPALASCAPPASALRAPVVRAAAASRNVMQRAALQPARTPAAAAAARRQLCRAAAEKEGGSSSIQEQGAAPQVPDTPPAPAGAQQQQQQQPAISTLSQAQPMSVEEIQQAAAQLRQQRAAGDAKEGLLEGVSEEIKLIKWPAPGKAVVQTVLVIAIVGGTAAALLAINGALAELGKLY